MGATARLLGTPARTVSDEHQRDGRGFGGTGVPGHCCGEVGSASGNHVTHEEPWKQVCIETRVERSRLCSWGTGSLHKAWCPHRAMLRGQEREQSAAKFSARPNPRGMLPSEGGHTQPWIPCVCCCEASDITATGTERTLGAADGRMGAGRGRPLGAVFLRGTDTLRQDCGSGGTTLGIYRNQHVSNLKWLRHTWVTARLKQMRKLHEAPAVHQGKCVCQ